MSGLREGDDVPASHAAVGPWTRWPCVANLAVLCAFAVATFLHDGEAGGALALAPAVAFAVAVALTPAVAATTFHGGARWPFAAVAVVALASTCLGIALRPREPLGPAVDLALAVATAFGTLAAKGYSLVRVGRGGDPPT